MAKIPTWKRALVEAQAKNRINQLYKQKTPELEEIKNKIADMIEKSKEEEHLQLLVIICSEIIAGLEEKSDRDFVIEMTKTTIGKIQ